MCFGAYGGYFRLSVGSNENRSVFTQQWPSKGNTHSCSVAEENRGKSLCHNWRNQIAALAALSDTLYFITPTCSVFLLHADLDIIWPALILPLFSSDFNKDRFGWPSCVRCSGASLAVRFRSASADWWTLITAGAALAAHQRCSQPARVEHPDWMQRMYRADIWCLDSDLLRAEQTLNSYGHKNIELNTSCSVKPTIG